MFQTKEKNNEVDSIIPHFMINNTYSDEFYDIRKGVKVSSFVKALYTDKTKFMKQKDQ